MRCALPLVNCNNHFEMSYRKCLVKNCTNTAQTAKLYVCPVDRERFKAWAAAVQRPELLYEKRQNLRVCEIHFAEDAKFLADKFNKTNLKKDAIPTLLCGKEGIVRDIAVPGTCNNFVMPLPDDSVHNFDTLSSSSDAHELPEENIAMGIAVPGASKSFVMQPPYDSVPTLDTPSSSSVHDLPVDNITTSRDNKRKALPTESPPRKLVKSSSPGTLKIRRGRPSNFLKEGKLSQQNLLTPVVHRYYRIATKLLGTARQLDAENVSKIKRILIKIKKILINIKRILKRNKK